MGNGKNERVRNESEHEPRGTTWYMGIWERKKNWEERKVTEWENVELRRMCNVTVENREPRKEQFEPL